MAKNVSDWFKAGSVYQINPRTFSHEGTLKAVEAELPFLAEVGFAAIYLCPIFSADDSTDKAFWSTRQKASATENPKNPYRMNDYFMIDEEYGSIDDLKDLTRAAHKLGLKVLLDLVYLHIGPNADILKAHPEFAQHNDDGSVRLTEWNFPYLNFQSEGLREYLYCNMTYYVGVIDVDGFRCDVGDAVPFDFWQEGKRRIRAIKPDCIMINEGARLNYLEVFDADYSFFWHNTVFDVLEGKMTGADALEQFLQKVEKLPQGGLYLLDMDNHDTVTDWPYRIEGHFGHAAMELILVLNYLLPGVPMVYCGNELGDTARLSMFANRFFMGGFEVTQREVLKNTADAKRRIEIVKMLNTLKKEKVALHNGKTKLLKTDHPTVLAFDRVFGDQKVTVIGNLSQEDVAVFAGDGEVLLSNNAKLINGKWQLSSYGYIVLGDKK